MTIVRILMLSSALGLLCLSAQEPEVLASPDGLRKAVVRDRGHYRGETIFLESDGQARDLLPDGTPIYPAPQRHISLGVWTDNRTLVFQQMAGTGRMAFYKIDVDTNAVTHIWTGSVDCCVEWSPRKDRVIVGTLMGGLIIVYSDGRQSLLRGCTISGDAPLRGEWYAFEAWANGGSAALIRRLGCDNFNPIDPKMSKQGVPLVWDGNSVKSRK